MTLGLVVALAFAGASAASASQQLLLYTGNGATFEFGAKYTRFATATGRPMVENDTLPADMSGYACVLLPVTTVPFTSGQRAQLASYASSGGTIVGITEHSDWAPGQVSINVMNDLMGNLGVAMVAGGSTDWNYNQTTSIDANEYTAGVHRIGYAATASVNLGGNAISLVRTKTNDKSMVARQALGLGAFVFIGDANAVNDFLGVQYTNDDNGQLVKNLCGDISPPTITITRPLDGARYRAGDHVPAAWTCTDPDSDVNPALTTATNAVGVDVKTTTAGAATETNAFTVSCTDFAGNKAEKTVHYKVDPSAPDVTIATPVDGGEYPRNAVVPASWGCSDLDGPADIDPSPTKTFGTKAPGQAIDTTMPAGAPVVKTFSATCTDLVGNTSTKTVQYTVSDKSPPVPAITAPLDGARYPLGKAVNAAWTCTDPDGDIDQNASFGTLPVGALINTGTAGTQTFTVFCQDLAIPPNTGQKTVSYFVDDSPPGVTIVVPGDGATYPRGSTQPANWSCTDADGDLDVKTKVATLPVGTPINTSALGVKTFNVTCTDQAGNVGTKTVSYRVVGGPPTVTIASPVEGKTYDQGQVVAPTYSCADPDDDLKSCVRVGGSGPVDTSKGGAFTFTVNAEDREGNTATKTIRYSVKAKPSTPGAAVSPSSKPGAAKVCASRRQFRIRVRKLKGGVKAVSATVFVNGKKTLTRKGKRVTAIVTLKGLKKGQYKVKINVKYSNGRVLSYTRKFKTCTPKGK